MKIIAPLPKRRMGQGKGKGQGGLWDTQPNQGAARNLPKIENKS